MALTISNIKRWYKMLTGQSVLHVHQDIGKCFSTIEIKGYYNNLTEKVTMQPELLHTDQLPLLDIGGDRTVYFPVAIFQYGLGAYDLYLMSGKKEYLDKFMQCLAWAVDHQEASGSWSNFFYIYPEHPYGAMAQGEGASLLVRGYVATGETFYLELARKALDFMLVSLEEGGTTSYGNGGVVLMEYTHLPAVMNGWIFAWFGLYDYVLAVDDQGRYREAMDRSLETLEHTLPSFDCSYWSMYDLNGLMASPFYHNLHIAQMQALCQITKREIFGRYARKWEADSRNPFKKSLAFTVKAWQKIMERE